MKRLFETSIGSVLVEADLKHYAVYVVLFDADGRVLKETADNWVTEEFLGILGEIGLEDDEADSIATTFLRDAADAGLEKPGRWDEGLVAALPSFGCLLLVLATFAVGVWTIASAIIATL